MFQLLTIATIAWDCPYSALKEFFRKIKRLGLHILRQTDCYGPGFHRRGEDTHCFWKGSEQLFWSLNTVPVARNRLQAIVNRDVLGLEGFQLLQNWRDIASGKNVSGKKQYWYAIDGRGSSAGKHVGCPRANRTCT